MAVQWSGSGAGAAAAALERHVRALDDRGKRPSPMTGALGVALSVLLPWASFAFAATFIVFASGQQASLVWGVLGGLGGLVCLTSLVGLSARRFALAVLGLWCFSSICFGVFMGHYANAEYMETYWKIRNAEAGISGVDPAAAEVAALGDARAAVLTFTPGSFVDDKRTLGYVAKGTIFCVAPVSRQGQPSSRVDFWAAGVGCCERRGNFDCGSSRQRGGSLTALSYPADGDRYFGEAVKLAVAVYNVTVGPRPQRVFFEGEPDAFLQDLLGEVLASAVLVAVFHLCTCVIISTALQKAGVRWANLFGRTDDSSGQDLLMRGGGSKEVRSLPALDAILLKEMEEEERSCLGCGPRHYWAFLSQSDYMQETEEKKVWHEQSEKLLNNKDPEWFPKTVIAKDGGFNEVQDNMQNVTWSRYFSTLAILGFILYNTCYIIKVDTKVLSQAADFMKIPGGDFYLISEVLINGFLHIFRVKSDIAFKGSIVVPCLELCALAFIFVAVVFLAVEGALAPPQSRRRWKNLYRVLIVLPTPLSCFSSMSLLHYVSPSVFAQDLHELSNRKRTTPIWHWSKFVVLRCTFFVVGFDAFLMKFRMTAESINTEFASVHCLLAAGGFLLQLMGLVQVDMVVRARLMRAFFGGEDAEENTEEKAKEVTYHALLLREMYKYANSNLEFLVMALSFSDTDLQALMLNTNTEKDRNGGRNGKAAGGGTSRSALHSRKSGRNSSRHLSWKTLAGFETERGESSPASMADSVREVAP